MINQKRAMPFNPPSLDEVSEYIKNKGFQVDPQQFLDFYESKGWMVGKNKMKDWRAAVRTWQRRNQPVSYVPRPLRLCQADCGKPASRYCSGNFGAFCSRECRMKTLGW